MNKIGRKLFYDDLGNIIVDTGEKQGSVIETTVEQDIATYTALSERNRNTFDVLELPFGAFAQDFAEGTLIGVDVDKQIPLFSYPDPNTPSVEQPHQIALSTQIAELKGELATTQEAVDFLLMGGM